MMTTENLNFNHYGTTTFTAYSEECDGCTVSGTIEYYHNSKLGAL